MLLKNVAATIDAVVSNIGNLDEDMNVRSKEKTIKFVQKKMKEAKSFYESLSQSPQITNN